MSRYSWSRGVPAVVDIDESAAVLERRLMADGLPVVAVGHGMGELLIYVSTRVAKLTRITTFDLYPVRVVLVSRVEPAKVS